MKPEKDILLPSQENLDKYFKDNEGMLADIVRKKIRTLRENATPEAVVQDARKRLGELLPPCESPDNNLDTGITADYADYVVRALRWVCFDWHKESESRSPKAEVLRTREGLGQFFQREHAKLVGFAKAMGCPEDVVSQARMTVHKQLPSEFEVLPNFNGITDAYVWTALRRACCDWHKANNKHATHRSDEHPAGSDSGDVGQQDMNLGLSDDDREEADLIIVSVLAQVNVANAIALWLTYKADLRVGTIAALQHRQPNTVTQGLSRCRNLIPGIAILRNQEGWDDFCRIIKNAIDEAYNEK